MSNEKLINDDLIPKKLKSPNRIFSYFFISLLAIWAIVFISGKVMGYINHSKFEEIKTFSNDYYSVDYPRNWKLSKDGNDISIFDKKSSLGYKNNILVQIQESSFGKAPTAESLADALLKEMSSYDDPYLSDYKMISSELVSHEGRDSAKVIARYTIRKANLDIISYNLLMPVGKKVFVLCYATPYSVNGDSDEFFNELISTFKIK